MLAHAGWRTRGYLPHYDNAQTVQHIVFRLADSLPGSVLASLGRTPSADRFAVAEQTLDRGVGAACLSQPRLAALVAGALKHFDGQRYDLIAWCVMPSHVHVLAAQHDGWSLAAVVHGWKSFTANRANAALGAAGRFWAPDYFDRMMRSPEQHETTLHYIENNPVAAGLCPHPAAWPWSSAAPP